MGKNKKQILNILFNLLPVLLRLRTYLKKIWCAFWDGRYGRCTFSLRISLKPTCHELLCIHRIKHHASKENWRDSNHCSCVDVKKMPLVDYWKVNDGKEKWRGITCRKFFNWELDGVQSHTHWMNGINHICIMSWIACTEHMVITSQL